MPDLEEARLRLPEPFRLSKSFFALAEKAYNHKMPAAAILYCLLSLDAFVWRVLWGKRNVIYTGLDGKNHRMSVNDFIYHFSQKQSSDFAPPFKYEEFRKRNKRLFKELRNSDRLMYNEAIKARLVKQEEAEIVSNMRTIRNAYSHFNPYEKTLRRYKEALKFFGITELRKEQKEIDYEVAEMMLHQTERLLKAWLSRVR